MKDQLRPLAHQAARAVCAWGARRFDDSLADVERTQRATLARQLDRYAGGLQAKQLGLKTKFMGTFWSMDNAIWAKSADVADGFMGVMPYRYYYDTEGKSPMLEKIRQIRPEYQSTGYMQGFLTAMLMTEAAKRTLDAKKDLTAANMKAALNSIKDFDTGGIIGVPISIPGNTVPVGRVYQYDGANKTMKPVSDWIKIAK